jgi:uncharacterized membrane protein
VSVPASSGASKSLARLLTAGIVLGCVLLAAGGFLSALQEGLVPGLGLGVTGFGVTGLDGPSLIRTGILVIILTPILRVAAVAAIFVQRDDRPGIVWAVAVLLLLTLATVLDLRH